MKSEKVKDIKENLEEEISFSKEYDLEFRRMSSNTLQDILTLINELESENERLLRVAKEKIHDIGEMGYSNAIETKQLKDRIAELEKEKKENTSYAKGYADGIKNTYEVVVPDKLKQFAERLKEKAKQHYEDDTLRDFTLEYGDVEDTLKEFINNKGEDKK